MRFWRVLAVLGLACAGCAAIESDRAFPPPDCDRALEAALGGPEVAARLRDWAPGDDSATGPLMSALVSRREEIDDLAARCPRHSPTLFASAVLAYAAGDREGAARGLDAALASEPSHVGASVLRSRIAIEEGNLPLARRLVERANHLRPAEAPLREAHAATLYLSGRLADASAALDAAERLGAPAWRIAFNRGLVAEASGSVADAEAQYRKSLEARPSFDAARQRLVGLTRARGR